MPDPLAMPVTVTSRPPTRARARQSLPPGGGVGAAGVDDDRPRLAERSAQVVAADLDRRGGEAVDREDAGRRGATVADDQSEVGWTPARSAARLLDPAGDPGEPEAARQA